jgi:hypothetical protein
VCAGAAFAYSYNIFNFGPGTLHSPLEAPGGGPYLDVCMYPTTSEPGKLLGQGSGYSQWDRSSNYATRTTKGVGIAKASGGLGDGGEVDKTVVVEGQIDTAGLAPGTYVLKLIPGTGINVLRGDANLVTDPSPQDQVQAFAVAANTTVGDEITFTITSPPVGSPPVIASAVSAKCRDRSVSMSILTLPARSSVAKVVRPRSW